MLLIWCEEFYVNVTCIKNAVLCTKFLISISLSLMFFQIQNRLGGGGKNWGKESLCVNRIVRERWASKTYLALVKCEKIFNNPNFTNRNENVLESATQLRIYIRQTQNNTKFGKYKSKAFSSMFWNKKNWYRSNPWIMQIPFRPFAFKHSPFIMPKFWMQRFPLRMTWLPNVRVPVLFWLPSDLFWALKL